MADRQRRCDGRRVRRRIQDHGGQDPGVLRQPVPEVSLKNNGGFASVRTKAKKLGLAEGDALVVKVRGDGREYSLNLYVPRPLVAFSYRATVAVIGKLGKLHNRLVNI
ncbi:MAG: CIA30 family protein [Gammaproteobacteria bacterium]